MCFVDTFYQFVSRRAKAFCGRLTTGIDRSRQNALCGRTKVNISLPVETFVFTIPVGIQGPPALWQLNYPYIIVSHWKRFTIPFDGEGLDLKLKHIKKKKTFRILYLNIHKKIKKTFSGSSCFKIYLLHTKHTNFSKSSRSRIIVLIFHSQGCNSLEVI